MLIFYREKLNKSSWLIQDGIILCKDNKKKRNMNYYY